MHSNPFSVCLCQNSTWWESTVYLLYLLKDTNFELEFYFEHNQRFLNASQSFCNVKFWFSLPQLILHRAVCWEVSQCCWLHVLSISVHSYVFAYGRIRCRWFLNRAFTSMTQYIKSATYPESLSWIIIWYMMGMTTVPQGVCSKEWLISPKQ